MIEKVNPSHPDKVADRIAGAIVDLAYEKEYAPKIAVEVLIGHGLCTVIVESDVYLEEEEIKPIVERIGGMNVLRYIWAPQDANLAYNQREKVRCGDNGIFRGAPLTDEERTLSDIARSIYKKYSSDGKYVLDGDRLIICQSRECTKTLKTRYPNAEINPIGEWSGGSCVDCGATNRKLGSDMGHSVTGGGLHGKDLSKADVAINIWCFLKAQETGKEVELSCAIGDEVVNGIPYEEMVETARKYIKSVGGFEKFAEWGLF